MSTSAEDIARSIVAKLEAAWNAADGAAFAEAFTEDATTCSAGFVSSGGNYQGTSVDYYNIS